jgi:hypothetical protein
MRAAEEGSHTVAGDKQLFAGDNDTDLDLIPGNQLLVGSISWNLTVELANSEQALSSDQLPRQVINKNRAERLQRVRQTILSVCGHSYLTVDAQHGLSDCGRAASR